MIKYMYQPINDTDANRLNELSQFSGSIKLKGNGVLSKYSDYYNTGAVQIIFSTDDIPSTIDSSWWSNIFNRMNTVGFIKSGISGQYNDSVCYCSGEISPWVRDLYASGEIGPEIKQPSSNTPSGFSYAGCIIVERDASTHPEAYLKNSKYSLGLCVNRDLYPIYVDENKRYFLSKKEHPKDHWATGYSPIIHEYTGSNIVNLPQQALEGEDNLEFLFKWIF